MKGTRYKSGVLVTQEKLNFTGQSKEESLKERFGALVDFGIVDGLAVTGDASDLNITSGEGFTDFIRTNTVAGYGDIGERVYAPLSLTSLARQVTSANVHVFATYIEIHEDRQADQVGNPYYTKEEDSFVITQLTDAELTTWFGAPTTGVFVSDNLVHATLQTDLTTLTDDELDDTFGSGNWDNTTTPGSLFVDVQVTQYNSLYLGTLNSSGTSVSPTEAVTRQSLFIKNNLINANILDTVQHRKTQHSNGIFGDRNTALFCNIDAVLTDQIEITDLATDEYAYMGGRRCNSGDIASGFLTIIASAFPTVADDYYVYVYYDTVNGDFRTTVESATTPILITDPNYMIISKVYWDNVGTLSAYINDRRYDNTSATNPVTDLRIFGSIESHNIGNSLAGLGGSNLLANESFESMEIDGSGDVKFSGWTAESSTTLAYSEDSLGGRQSMRVPAGTVISVVVPYYQDGRYTVKATVKGVATTGTYSIGIRGYVGKDYKIDPANHIGINTFDAAIVKTTSWSEKFFTFDRSDSDEWTGVAYTTTYAYPGDINLIKYVAVDITNNSGSDILVDSVLLLHNESYFYGSNFQVSGNTDANLIVADTSQDNVGFGKAPAAGYMVEIAQKTTNGENLRLAGDFASPSAVGGEIIFANVNDTDAWVVGSGASNEFRINNLTNDFLICTVDAVIVNPNGINMDFQVQGDADTTLFVTEASTDSIGVGLAAHADRKINITTSKLYGIHSVCTDVSSGNGLTSAPAGGYGESTNTGTYGFGLHGISHSSNGHGIHGQGLGSGGVALYGYTAVGTSKVTIQGDNRSTSTSVYAGLFEIEATDSNSYAVYGVSGGGSSYAGGGNTAWHTVSDKFIKINKRDVSILDKLRLNPIKVKQFMYEDASNTGFNEHIGPMAQDICSTFDLSEDDEKLGDNVAGGIALGGVVELLVIIDNLENRLAVLESV